MPRSRKPGIPRARTLRKRMTPAETRLWWHLGRVPVAETHFRRQAPIGPYVVDFVCHRHRLVIEVDGGHHGLADQAAADARRTAWLATRGYRVLRFSNAEVAYRIAPVLDTIYAALYTGAMMPGGDAGDPPSSLSVPAEGNRLPAPPCPTSSSNCAPKRSPPACSGARPTI